MSTLTNVSNVVSVEKLREIQSNTLNNLSDILENSFGPNGSTTCIKKENGPNVYTKDGYNILTNVLYHGIIEESIKEDIESITRHIVTTVGDGTTSAVLLSNTIFNKLCSIDSGKTLPSEILKTLDSVVNKIKAKIKSNAKECTPDDIYEIAMISSNGNEEVATNIKNIYEDYGMSVFIDVNISNTPESVLKVYDGITLNAGYYDTCFVNTDKNECIIREPCIYFFEDPIDTPEMCGFLDAIIMKNIYMPLNNTSKSNNPDDSEVIPTVIVAPSISRDMSATLDSIINQFAAVKGMAKPPLLILNGFSDTDIYNNIIRLCGGKSIHKYIDPNIQAMDIKSGKAPTIETIQYWNGSCDEVSADSSKAKFINPSNMKNPDGTYTEIYNNIISMTEKELSAEKAAGSDARTIGSIKRKLNALKGNMVEYLVGGISMEDRDALRDLVEDSVKNTRSAALNGYGYAANFEALRAMAELEESDELDSDEVNMLSILRKAYVELIEKLYRRSLGKYYEEYFNNSLEQLKPVNLRDVANKVETQSLDVKSSIESDIIILDSVSKIIGLMYTTNQFIVPTPIHNVYTNF